MRGAQFTAIMAAYFELWWWILLNYCPLREKTAAVPSLQLLDIQIISFSPFFSSKTGRLEFCKLLFFFINQMALHLKAPPNKIYAFISNIIAIVGWVQHIFQIWWMLLPCTQKHLDSHIPAYILDIRTPVCDDCILFAQPPVMFYFLQHGQ